METLLIAFLNKMCHIMDCYGEGSIQEINLSPEAFTQLKQFGKWHDDNRLKMQISGSALIRREKGGTETILSGDAPVFDYTSDPILPDIENRKLLINGYTFNIKTPYA